VTTTTVYDRRGNVAETRDGAGGVSSTVYDEMNRPAGVYDADGVATWYSYDLAGQLVEERRNRSTDTYVPDYWEDRTTFTYDVDGRRTGTTDPRGNVPGADPAAYTTTVQYDDDGRPVARTDPLGRSTAVTYDAAGRRLTATDASGGVTTSTYDQTGLLTSVTSADGSTTSYGYDAAGRLVERTDALGRVTTYAYDAAGRETSRTDPLGRTSTTAYDAAGQVAFVVAPSGTETTDDPDDGTTTYAYDDAGRLVERSFSDSTPSFTYAYTDAGRPLGAARIQSGVTLSSTANDYDDLGRLVGVTRTGPGAVDANYAYTAAGRLAGASWSSGMTVSYGYNSVGQLVTATPGGVSGLTAVTYGYDPAGNLTSTTRAGSKKTVSTSTYDGAGQLTALKHMAGTTVVAEYALAHDARGNPSTVAATAAGQTSTTAYAYDEVNRLTLECRPSSGTACTSSSPATAYGYDAVGNRVTQEQRSVSGTQVTTVTTTSTYDDADQLLTQVVDGATTLDNTWSPNGTLASSETDAGTRTFGFDLAGELGAVGLEDGTYVAFTYDTQGNRTSRSQDGVLDVSWSWDDVVAGESVRVGEDAAASSPDSTWLPDPTSGTAAPLAARRGSTTSWLLADPFGSAASSVRPGTTTITGRQTFTAFGLALAPATGELAGQGVGYLGQYLDAVVGEYDLRARSYDAASGRFTAADPVDVPVGMPFANGYAYAFNNPLLLQDITGEWAECGPIGSVCDGSNLIPVFNRMSRDFDDAGYLALYASLTPEQADEIGYDDLWYIHVEAANRLEHQQVCANNPGQCLAPCPDDGYHGCVAGRAALVLGGFVLGQAAGIASSAILGRLCAAATTEGHLVPQVLRVGDLKLPAVPRGSVGTPTLTGKGMEYVIPRGTAEISERVASIRIMEPVTSGKYQYPNGYAVYMNDSGQTINPLTGKTVAPGDPYAHIPLP
jgi:RHS repeat-associated protein